MYERFVPRNIGDEIEILNCVQVDGISSVVPVRYNGHSNTYVVCRPDQATHDAIVTDDDRCIVVSKECTGKEAIVDIL